MKNNTIWVLVAGLAVGFLVGREVGRSGSGGEEKSSSGAARSATGKAGAKDIPPDWLKETDFNSVDAVKDLTADQKYLVLKIMNELPCDCGCPHGSFAKCKKEDPGCPRAPQVVTKSAELAKAGKSFEDIKEALKKPAAPPPQAQEDRPQKIELAAWTPVKGPKYAKITIVEYSDFQ